MAKRTNRVAWGLAAVLAGGLLGGAVLWVRDLLRTMQAFEMKEEVGQQIVSPDGRHKAVLSYLNGLTYGYYHVLLERATTQGRREPTEITEVADEGLVGIAWRDARTLVVRYSCPEKEFVVRTQQWDGVRIKYRRE